MTKYVKLGIVGLVFALGLYFSAFAGVGVEGFMDKPLPACPDLLLEEDNKFYLYNSNLVKVPGVNPVVFDTLEDYVQFIDWQRSQGVRCNIQYLRKINNAQGETKYRFVDRVGGRDVRPGRDNPRRSKLVDAGRNEAPYNNNSFPSFDPQDQYVGTYTPLDKMFSADKDIQSTNPMDTNWGGHEYTVENTARIKEHESTSLAAGT